MKKKKKTKERTTKIRKRNTQYFDHIRRYSLQKRIVEGKIDGKLDRGRKTSWLDRGASPTSGHRSRELWVEMRGEK